MIYKFSYSTPSIKFIFNGEIVFNLDKSNLFCHFSSIISHRGWLPHRGHGDCWLPHRGHRNCWLPHRGLCGFTPLICLQACPSQPCLLLSHLTDYHGHALLPLSSHPYTTISPLLGIATLLVHCPLLSQVSCIILFTSMQHESIHV